MRGTNIGDLVRVRLSATREAHGTVAVVEPVTRLRLVLTAQGHVWAAPDEMSPSDIADHTVAIEDVEVGDVVVMHTGVHRRIARGIRDRGEFVLIFEPAPDGSWPLWAYSPGDRVYVIR